MRRTRIANSSAYQMPYKRFTLLVMVICFAGTSGRTVAAEPKESGQIHWVEGYVRAVGEGTSTPSGNKMKDQLRAIRAATVMAQRALVETVKGVRIDSQTRIENKMIQDDHIKTRIEGTVQGAEVVRQDVRWEGETPVATIELQICLSGWGGCKSGKSILDALPLNQKIDPSHAPQEGLKDGVTHETALQKVSNILYDSSKPVTGLILNLHGLSFERELLPVVIAMGDQNRPFTIYSVRNVEPQVIRTYGVVRYADSVAQARQNPHLGENPMLVPVSGITKENRIMIELDAARVIGETTRHGNDYLRQAKVIIAAK